MIPENNEGSRTIAGLKGAGTLYGIFYAAPMPPKGPAEVVAIFPRSPGPSPVASMDPRPWASITRNVSLGKLISEGEVRKDSS